MLLSASDAIQRKGRIDLHYAPDVSFASGSGHREVTNAAALSTIDETTGFTAMLL